MEESISSSRTTSADSYASGAVSDDDSGWTAYFDDFFQASRKEPEPREKLHHHGGCGTTASTVSSAANGNKLNGKASEERKRPDLELEDALQDTATSSPTIAAQMAQDNWQWHNAACEQRPSTPQWSAGYVNALGAGQVPQEAVYTEIQKRGVCLVPLTLFVDQHHLL